MKKIMKREELETFLCEVIKGVKQDSLLVNDFALCTNEARKTLYETKDLSLTFQKLVTIFKEKFNVEISEEYKPDFSLKVLACGELLDETIVNEIIERIIASDDFETEALLEAKSSLVFSVNALNIMLLDKTLRKNAEFWLQKLEMHMKDLQLEDKLKIKANIFEFVILKSLELSEVRGFLDNFVVLNMVKCWFNSEEKDSYTVNVVYEKVKNADSEFTELVEKLLELF